MSNYVTTVSLASLVAKDKFMFIIDNERWDLSFPWTVISHDPAQGKTEVLDDTGDYFSMSSYHHVVPVPKVQS